VPSRLLRRSTATVAAAAVTIVLAGGLGRGASATPAHPATAAPATTSSGPASVTSTLNGLKLVSWYPAGSPWVEMWLHWDLNTVNADFSRIAALHANTVRLVIDPYVLGYPTPDPTQAAHLSQTIAAAAAHGLEVQLTLFDWWDSFGDLSGSNTWIDDTLAPYHNDRRIAFVELKNEVDPSNSSEMAWVRAELPIAKSAIGAAPVTVSLASSEGLGGLVALKDALSGSPIDFYDVHYYGPPGSAYAALSAAKSIVAPIPLYVGETGWSTTPGSVATEAEQALYFESVEWATVQLGLPLAAPWILYDFVPGSIPPQADAPAADYTFGLFHDDGSPKPAATFFTQLFGSGVPSTAFNGGFEQASGGIPLDWATFHPSEATLAWDPTVAHSGAASVRISSSMGDNSGLPSFVTAPPVVPTHAGQSFTAAVWAKGQAATGLNRIAVSWFDAYGNYLSMSGSSWLPGGTTGWAPLSVTSAAPANAAFEEISLQSTGNTGTVWFDDVTLTVSG
jgi:hypothetical protein